MFILATFFLQLFLFSWHDIPVTCQLIHTCFKWKQKINTKNLSIRIGNVLCTKSKLEFLDAKTQVYFVLFNRTNIIIMSNLFHTYQWHLINFIQMKSGSVMNVVSSCFNGISSISDLFHFDKMPLRPQLWRTDINDSGHISKDYCR